MANSAGLFSTSLFSAWAAKVLSGKKRRSNRRPAANSRLQVESLETRVMLTADPNDQISEAVIWTRSQMSATIKNNSITFAGDVNMHGFTVFAGEQLGIDLDFPPGGSALNARFRLFDAAGVELANNDDGPTPGELASNQPYIAYTFTTAGTYYLGVSYTLNNAYDPITGNGDNTTTGTGLTGGYDIIFTSLNVDPDDQISEATVLPRSVIGNTTAAATINIPTDVDMYRFEAVAGETFGFDLDRTAGTLDSAMRLFDSLGNVLLANNDGAAPGEVLGTDSYISYTFTASGFYYIGISASPNTSYSANTGNGDRLSPSTTGDYTLTILNIDSNDQISEATPITVGVTLTDTIVSGIDVNTYAVTAAAGQLFYFDIDRPTGALDSRLRLFDASGTVLATNDHAVGPGSEFSPLESYLEYTFATAGTYYISVSFALNDSYNAVTGDGDYTPITPAVGAYDLTVGAGNQAPIITAATPPAYSIWNTTVTFAGANAFFVADPDAGSAPVKVQLATFSSTTVTLSQVTGLTFTAGDGTSDGFMEFTGSIADINAAFNGMTAYTGNMANTTTTISLAVDDLGNSGAGGPRGTTSTVTWTNQIYDFGVADAGVLRLYGLEDAETSYVRIDANGNVVFRVNDVDYVLPVLSANVTQALVYLRGGNDSFTVDASAAGLLIRFIDAGLGDDTVNASALINDLSGPIADLLVSEGGIRSGGGFDTLRGGQGNDLIFLSNPLLPVVFAGGIVYGGAGNDSIIGSNAVDVIYGEGGDDFIYGQGGDDYLDGGEGNNGMEGEEGNDTIAAGNGNNIIYGRNGNDVIATGDGSNTIYGDEGNDTISTGAGADTIYGLDGDDTINAGAGNDNVFGGAGIDRIDAGDGDDTVTGDAGTDRITGGAGNDSLSGGSDSDTYFFNGSVNQGSDSLFELTGEGSDMITFQDTASTANLTINLGSTAMQVVSPGLLSIQLNSASTFENAIGGAGNDTLIGNELSNVFDGMGGNDQYYGLAGNDLYSTITGNDTFYFDADTQLGTDTIIAMGGVHTIDFSATTTVGTRLNLGLYATDQVVNANLSLYLFNNSVIQNIVGSERADNYIGTAADNMFDLRGGDDTATGMEGNDIIFGGAGNDTLTGGDGNDDLYGGTDSDTFVFNASIAQGSDRVFEFANQGSDLLDFSATTSVVNLNLDLRNVTARVLSAGLTLQLSGSNTVENAFGGAGNDTLIGNSVNNNLDGRGGNDLYYGLAGNDTYRGSEGDDTYFFDATTQLGLDTISGSDAGVDTINFFSTKTLGTTLDLGLVNLSQVVNANLTLVLDGSVVIENILGTEQVDNYRGNSANNQFDLRGGDDVALGFDGNDRFIGGGGNDSLTGGNGNDTYVFDADLVEGTDTLVEVTSLIGGIDTLDFTPTNLTTSALNINLGTPGVQVVRAGALSLALGFSNNFENVIGGAGNDIVAGNNLANSLFGGIGADLIYGFGANDSLDGGLGNDTYMFAANANIGTDTVTDAGGTDTLNWLATTTGSGASIVLGSTAEQNVFFTGNHRLRLLDGNSIENVIGTNQNDYIIGNSLNNLFTANAGNDLMEGLGGNDTLVGGAGDDTYVFDVDNDLGSDLLNDAAGLDSLDFTSTLNTQIQISLRLAGGQTVAAGRLSLSLQNATAFEVVYGGAQNDIIVGNGVRNYLYGFGGNDSISGQDGEDYISGGDGDDSLFGEAGNDILIGGTGNDSAFGGADSDILVGGVLTTETSFAAINAALDPWSSRTIAYADRVAIVRLSLIPNDNVINDGAGQDILRGADIGLADTALDLFYSNDTFDILPDLQSGETRFQLDL